jgi:hypothetical protein
MGNTALKYSFYAIITFLGVSYATGAGTLLKSGGTSAAGVIKAFQGR